MVNSVAPVWDGNETWLVLGGAGLFGAFPLAYAVITDALVIPLTAMLIGLIFRGVAFEFRLSGSLTSHLLGLLLCRRLARHLQPGRGRGRRYQRF